MDTNEAGSIKVEPGVALQVASLPSEMDVDTLPPPSKRIKSTTSRDPSPLCQESFFSTGAHDEDATLMTAKHEVTPTRDASNDMYSGVKVEHDSNAEVLVPTVKSDTTSPSGLLKTESATATSLTLPEETLPSPAAKKKKTSSAGVATKKEVSTSSVSGKSKKVSGSSKKGSVSMSSSTLQDPSQTPSNSRSKPKLEEAHSPIPPKYATNKDDVEEEEEDNTLYCICQRRQDDVEGGMIMCDRCEQWYHYRCMSITEDDVELVDQFICPPCHQITGEQTTYKAACARVRCRRAAMMPFSKYCSDRCGELAVMAKLAALKVGTAKNGRDARETWEADGRVKTARKTEGLTQHEKKWGEENREWQLVVQAIERNRVGTGLDLAGVFAMMANPDGGQGSVQSNVVPNGIIARTANGAARQLESSPSLSNPEVGAALSGSPSSASISSAISLIALDEQLHLVNAQIRCVDLEKARLNARLDRLDLRSTLLHLVSDRVPTLPPIGSNSSTSATTTNLNSSVTPDHLGGVDHDADEDMVESDAPKKSKKKKANSNSKSKSKSSSTTDTNSGGPRCGYDQRLHWDDAEFDAWSQTSLGRCILSHELPLNGTLDDPLVGETNQAESEPKVVCGVAKRKCRRHLDWSNLCELTLDAEKAILNADSSVLTRRKFGLVQLRERLMDEVQAVTQIKVVQERREKRLAEERDSLVARALASQGTRRETVH